jgi:DNA-binding MarR family transcriptional regulator
MPAKSKPISVVLEPRPVRRGAAEPYFRIGFLVHDVSRMRRTVFDQAIKPLGVTRAQWWALANLSRHESEGMIQSDLARLLDVGKVTIGGLIDRLEASGHVERRPDREDRRIKRIYITDKGYDVIEKMTSVGRDLNRIILKGISLDQIHQAEEVMAAMKANLRECLGGSVPTEPGERSAI